MEDCGEMGGGGGTNRHKKTQTASGPELECVTRCTGSEGLQGFGSGVGGVQNEGEGWGLEASKVCVGRRRVIAGVEEG